MLKRLLALLFTALAALIFVSVGGCAYGPTVRSGVPPVVFLHGDGESAAYWQDMVWRFESNGWPRERLLALQQPLAHVGDVNGQAGRSFEAEQLALLTSEVQTILAQTGEKQLVLIGHGRGALTVRNYILSGGNQTVSHAVLSGPDAPQPGSKVSLSLADFGSDALKGVKSLVFASAAQPDGAFSQTDFEASYRFITGLPAASPTIWPQVDLVLAGTVTGMGAHSGDRASAGSHFYNNLPTPKVQLEIFAVQRHTGLRLGPALYTQALGVDGRWGPFQAEQGVAYEFVTRAPGYAVTHTYRSPFPRGSQLVHLKTSRIADADLPAFSIIELQRHRGRSDPFVHHIVFDGQPVPPVKITLTQLQSRPIAAEIHTDMIERVVGRTWPAKESHVVRLELSQ